MKKWIIISVVFLGLLVISLGPLFKNKTSLLISQSTDEKINQLNQQIAEYQKQIQILQGQANTLSNQIKQFDTQIRLTELQINQTQETITLLGGRIDQLEVSLEGLTKAFSSRAVETYKLSRFGDNFAFIAGSKDLGEAVTRQHYLKLIQESDRDLMSRLQKAQNSYKIQKVESEELQKKLEDQKKVLDSQKRAKANLLASTKNDEKKYQQLLAQAKAEFEAIQAIIAGKGQEEEVGAVSQGQKIASVIQGASCNSGGTHLHFIVSQKGNAQNPFTYLKSADHENCSGSSCGSGDGDSFNPSGSWDWPISPKIKFTQGYGSTWATRNSWVGRIYNFHNGIDINGTSPEVRAVRSGKLFRGSYGGSGGCRLKYVRVDHDESDLDTFYLHINY